jgi:DNA-binding MarR family transcriptional regulator
VHQAIECLGRLSDAFQRRRADLAESVGLSEREWSLLEEVSTEHFMPSMFARERESTPAAVSKIIRQLIDKGLVNVTLSKGDGRHRDYVLTSKGKKVMAALRARREEAIQRVWLALSRDDVERFIRFGNELIARLEGYSDRRTEE